jgi:cobalamin biosynthesis Mg chelatase CobN
MNRKQRICLSLVCTLALVLLPLAYSTWAQSTQSSNQSDQSTATGTNQDQTQTQGQDQNKATDQNNSNLNDRNVDQTDQGLTREKPSTNPESGTTPQNQYQNQNTGSQAPYGTQNPDQSTESTSSDTTGQNAGNQEGMPRTAGELPLIALIGLLSLGAAAGTRILSRAQSR